MRDAFLCSTANKTSLLKTFSIPFNVRVLIRSKSDISGVLNRNLIPGRCLYGLVCRHTIPERHYNAKVQQTYRSVCLKTRPIYLYTCKYQKRYSRFWYMIKKRRFAPLLQQFIETRMMTGSRKFCYKTSLSQNLATCTFKYKSARDRACDTAEIIFKGKGKLKTRSR